MDLISLYQDFAVVAAEYLPAMQWAVDHEPYRYHAFCRADDRLCRARDAGDEVAFAQHLSAMKTVLRSVKNNPPTD